MFIKALLAFMLLPGIFSGILPVYLGLNDPDRVSGTDFGLIPITAGLVLLLGCVREFYVAGKGTLAPWQPPKRLVSTGMYRFTRNPMYVAVLLIILGLAMIFGSPRLYVYFCVAAVVFHLRIVYHEEKWLKSQFAPDWARYQSEVPRWLPSLKKLITGLNHNLR